MADDTAGAPTFPMPRTDPLDPPPGYADLRAHGPVVRAVFPDGRPVWLIIDHPHCRQILTDQRISSSRDAPGFPTAIYLPASVRKDSGTHMIGMDPPEHAAHRRVTITEFTVRRMRDLRPRIQAIVDEHIDALLAGPRPADLVAALSLPVPSLVICELLGVPYEDRAFFQSRSGRLLANELPAEDRVTANRELVVYLDALITEKEKEPGDDLLARTMARYREAGLYDHRTVRDMARLLLVAGHETTANMISLGVLGLLRNPGQLAAVKADPELIPTAVDGLLRYFTITDTVGMRTALADIEIGGVTIPKGDGLIALTGSANRDPAEFAEPDRLDVRRSARHHLTFGYGVHQCLGQNLAHLELEVTFETLFRRVPGLRLAAAVEDLPFKHGAIVYGLHELPVTW
ncbi:MAG: cytochrome P450 [Streptosporangiales bacterium]|nr:cytochrome P450 [Streptosporangiales bacterium]